MNAADALAAGPTRQTELLAAGTLTSRGLTEAALAAIERGNPAINATVEVFADEALEAADDADRRRAAGDSGPFLGVPLAVKDDLDIAGKVTGRGSNAASTVAAHDSDLVAALRAAGAVIVAKSTLPELAIFGFTESDALGITRNPHNHEHTPGGSSGGSAALVAAGIVGIATASDGAGSIRIPASCCGLVGFKPSHDTMPSSGGWHGLSTQGSVASRLVDAALFLDTFGTFPTSLVDAAAGDPQPLSIGLSYSAAAATRALPLDPRVRAALEAAAETFRAAGHTVTEVKIPYANDAKSLTIRYLAGIRDGADGTDDPSKLEKRTRGIARLGRPFGTKAVDWAIRKGREWGDGVHDTLDVDILLTPVMSGPAVPVEHWKGRGPLRTVLSMNAFYPYTAQWNHAGVPAVSMPAGKTAEEGLPLAIQLIARRDDDALLMTLAGQYEKVDAVTWDPSHYLQFADDRSRPFLDLVARIPGEPRSIVDLGCGPGHLTAVLRARWPEATIHGVDSSPEMMDRANAGNDDPHATYEVDDVSTWTPQTDVDAIVSNALFQWVPDQLAVIERLSSLVPAGGTFALQVPNNYAGPSHTLLHEISSRGPYASHTEHLHADRRMPPEAYLELFTRLGWQADVWETTYLHVLKGDDPVFSWISSTGARPIIQALPDGLREEFVDEYKAALRQAYPHTPHGTVFRFERVFAVARQSE